MKDGNLIHIPTEVISLKQQARKVAVVDEDNEKSQELWREAEELEKYMNESREEYLSKF